MQQENVMVHLANVGELLRVGFSLCLVGREAQPRVLLPLELLMWCLQGVPGAIQPLLPRWCYCSSPNISFFSGASPVGLSAFPGGEAASLRAFPRRSRVSPPAPPAITEQVLLPQACRQNQLAAGASPGSVSRRPRAPLTSSTLNNAER